jgi:hypothetical protein
MKSTLFTGFWRGFSEMCLHAFNLGTTSDIYPSVPRCPGTCFYTLGHAYYHKTRLEGMPLLWQMGNFYVQGTLHGLLGDD